MSDDRFPYGNDLRRPVDWLGNPDTKSRTYLAAYLGGSAISVAYRSHRVGFFGLESMCIGIFSFQTFGVQGSVGPGKIVKWLGNKIGWRVSDAAADTVDTADNVRTQGDYMAGGMNAGQNNPYAVYSSMSGSYSRINAKRPFSMNDLNSSHGRIIGFEIEAIGAASFYRISAGDNEIDMNYFFSQQIFNTGWGAAGIGGGFADGRWVLDDFISAYHTPTANGMGPDDRPYRDYAVPAYFQMLPPPSHDVPDHVVRLGEEYASGLRQM